MYLFIHTSIRLFIHSFIPLFIYLFIYSSIHSFTHLFVLLFVHLFFHSSTKVTPEIQDKCRLVVQTWTLVIISMITVILMDASVLRVAFLITGPYSWNNKVRQNASYVHQAYDANCDVVLVTSDL